MKRTSRSGFTLVEVLTMVAILALLAALILGLVGGAQKKAARDKAESEVSQLESFLTDYQMKYGRVPQTKDALAEALKEANHSLSNMRDPWGNAYEYEASSETMCYLWSTAGTKGADPSICIGNPKP